MLQRDQDVRGHLPRLKLHSICVFFILAVATVMIIFYIREPNTEYICHMGVRIALTAPRTNPVTGSTIPDFKDIRSFQDTWLWLSNTVPEELLKPDSRLRSNNYLPGWLELRMQQVAPPSARTCGTTGLPAPGALCSADRYDSKTANRLNLELVEELWVNRSGVDGRSASIDPWKYMPGTESTRLMRTLGGSGPFSSFDASGYAVMYNLQPPNLTATYEAFIDDMWSLRRAHWLNTETRSLQLKFAAFNGNHDVWLASTFTLEMTPSGVVFTRARVNAYRPMFMDWHWRMMLIIDAVRLGLVLYVCTWHLYRNIQYNMKERPNLRFYRILCWRDYVDLLLGCVFVYIFTVRYFMLGALSKNTAEFAQDLGNSFSSVQREADAYRGHSIAEATVLGLALVRFIYVCRVNRHVFIIWETLFDSLRSYGGFVLIFWPIFLAFVTLAHALWGTDALQNKTWWDSFTLVLMMLCGDWTVIRPTAEQKPATMAFMVGFWFIMMLLFVNTWVAVVVHTYQKTRVAAGFDPKTYAWRGDDWVRWLLWSPLARVWRWLRPRRHDEA